MAIRQKGSKWQVDVTVGGVRAPRVSVDSRREAEVTEADFKARLLAGTPPEALVLKPEATSTRDTLGGLIKSTVSARWAGSKAEASAYRNATAWAEALGYDYLVADLDAAIVSEVCDTWAAKGNAAGTINRKLAALSVMLKVAEERGLIDKLFRLPKRKEYEGRLRWYDDEEVESLLDYAAGMPDFHALFILAVETGLRQGELLALTKRDLDLDRGVILLGRTKGNKRRSVLLTARATAAALNLTGAIASHEKLFGPNVTCGNISRVVRAWKAERGLPDDDEACFHTFRHTCCSRLVQRGVPLPVVQKWMGHAAIQTTMRYAHLAPDSLDLARDALEGETK